MQAWRERPTRRGEELPWKKSMQEGRGEPPWAKRQETMATQTDRGNSGFMEWTPTAWRAGSCPATVLGLFKI